MGEAGPVSNLYELLLRFDPAGLHEAAKAWRALSSGAQSAENRHRNQVNGPLRNGNWEGRMRRRRSTPWAGTSRSWRS